MPTSRADAGARLSVGADPVAGESLPGFVMRLASGARFPTADHLAAMAGLRQPGSATASADLRPLAALAGTDRLLLEAAAYRPAPRRAHHHFLGGTVHREFLRIGWRRACPPCLAAARHHRAGWDLALATACPEHGVRLVERCPGCGARLGWRHPDLARCRCGADLLAARPVPAPAAEAAANREIVDLIGAPAVAWLPAALAGCDRADLVRLAMCLGMFGSRWGRQRRIETLVAAGPDAVAEVLCLGLEALRDWPDAIHRHLAGQGAGAAARRGRYGARKTLGGFYGWLTGLEGGGMKDALADAAAGYVSRDPALVRRTHRSALLARAAGARAVVGLNEAAGLLGVTGGSVKKMMAAGMLPAAASEGRGVPMLIGRAAVAGLAEALPGTLSLAGAAAALGVSKDRVRRLAAGGALRTVHRAGAEGWARWAFAPADIASLLLAMAPPPGAARPVTRTVGFGHAAEAFRRRGVGIAALVAMVRDGRLPVAGLDGAGRGLKRLRFAAAGVRTLCRGLEDGGGLTVQAAAERMGLKWQVAANLVQRGHLASRDGRVSVEDIDRFLAEHVSGGDLARERRTSPRALAADLARRGVTPLAGPGVDGSRQNIYRRRDIA